MLYKTTLVVWSSKKPPEPTKDDLGPMGEDADAGRAYLSSGITEEITDQSLFPQTEYFDV